MRRKSQNKTVFNEDTGDNLNALMCLLFRCFLAFVLFICGIVFPDIKSSNIPKEMKNLPVYISYDYSLDEVKEFMDGMAN